MTTINDRPQAARRTGPRTRSGKARVARNGLRHGLSPPALADPATTAAIDILAQLITKDAPGAAAEAAELARDVAQAQVDLIRVRRVRRNLLAAAFAEVAGGAPETAAQASGRVDAAALASRRSAWRPGSLRAARPVAPQVRHPGLPRGAGTPFWQNPNFLNENRGGQITRP